MLDLCLHLILAFAPAWAGDYPYKDRVIPPPPPPSAICEEFMVGRFGPRVRTRDTHEPRIVFSQRRGARTENSDGFRISAMDADELKRAMTELITEADGAPVAGEVSLSGLPLYDRRNREFVRTVEATLAELGLEGSVKVIPRYHPQSRGVMGALGRLRGLLPMRQDYERPVAAEITMGTPATLLAELATIGYAIWNFPLKIAAPLSLSHFGILGTLAALARTQQNWMNRSYTEAKFPSRDFLRTEAGKLVKDYLIANLFVVNYTVASNWPKIVASLGRFGLAHNPDARRALADFGVNQLGVTGVTQTLFFYTAFINGLWRWQAIVTRRGDPEQTRLARNAGAVLQPAIFAISGPILNWASTSTRTMFSIGSIGVNPGQVALGCLAIAGCAAAAAPDRVFTPLVEPLNAWIYDPVVSRWRRAMDAWRNRGGRTPEAAPNEVTEDELRRQFPGHRAAG